MTSAKDQSFYYNAAILLAIFGIVILAVKLFIFSEYPIEYFIVASFICFIFAATAFLIGLSK